MSVSYNTSIVTSGLVCYLDAANTKSYPGSGTTWTDISKNGNDSILATSPLFSPTYGGCFLLDGTNYMTNTTYKPSGARSLFMWVFYNELSEALCGTQEVNAYNYIGVYNGQLYSYVGNGAGGGSLNFTLNAGTWYNIGFTMDGFGTTKYYVNGNLVDTKSNGLGVAPTLPFQVGAINGSYKLQGKVNAVKCYNRAISSTEVMQNFNALKGRYIVEYVPLTYVVTGNATVTNKGMGGDNIFKTSGGVSWDSQAYSLTPFTAPCTIEFTKKAVAGDNGLSYAMIGWNVDPTTDASYTSLDAAAYPYTMNVYQVYDGGSGYAYGAWSSIKRFFVVYDTDGWIRHYNDNNLIASFNKGVGNTVYVDTSLYVADATYGGFLNVKVCRRSWNGTRYV